MRGFGGICFTLHAKPLFQILYSVPDIMRCFQTTLQNQIDISGCKNVVFSSLECFGNENKLVNRVGKKPTSFFYSA